MAACGAAEARAAAAERAAGKAMVAEALKRVEQV